MSQNTPTQNVTAAIDTTLAARNVPKQSDQKETWSEWGQRQTTQWKPWLESWYLKWFTKDNKTSYVAKDNLNKTKVTGIQPVDKLQDGVNNLATGQLGQGGLFEPVSNRFDKEVVDRGERGGKDAKGAYLPTVEGVRSTLFGGK